MIAFYTAAMQNAIMNRNMIASQMMSNSDRMLSSVSFGNSQPLRPSFYGDTLEIQNKVNETKTSVLNKYLEAIEKRLSKAIKRTTPKYTGIDSKKS